MKQFREKRTITPSPGRRPQVRTARLAQEAIHRTPAAVSIIVDPASLVKQPLRRGRADLAIATER
jgi:hypothetical protein